MFLASHQTSFRFVKVLVFFIILLKIIDFKLL